MFIITLNRSNKFNLLASYVYVKKKLINVSLSTDTFVYDAIMDAYIIVLMFLRILHIRPFYLLTKHYKHYYKDLNIKLYLNA